MTAAHNRSFLVVGHLTNGDCTILQQEVEHPVDFCTSNQDVQWALSSMKDVARVCFVGSRESLTLPMASVLDAAEHCGISVGRYKFKA